MKCFVRVKEKMKKKQASKWGWLFRLTAAVKTRRTICRYCTGDVK